MEPPGGLPPDRDRQLVLRPQQQQQLVPLAPPPLKPTLTLNLPQQQQQLALNTIASSSALAATTSSTYSATNVVASTSANVGGSGTNMIGTAFTTVLVMSKGSNNDVRTTVASSSTVPSTSPALATAATAISATTQAATAFSGSSVGAQHVQHVQHVQHHHHQHQPQQQQQQHISHHHQQQTHQQPSTLHQHHTHPHAHSHPHSHSHQHHGHHAQQQSQHGQNAASATSSLLGGISASSMSSTSGSSGQQQTIEKLSRPMAFDKMEALVREMQDPENGVPVRQQKMFLTSIPYAFMGYDLIEWLMDRLLIEESEALNIANQLCLHGYFFPVNDTKTLTVKDDSSLYRFQTPYYWPWQHKAPDNVEYAIYLAKRSLRNKQRHALEDYEAEALASLHKNLKGKWDFISMQAEEQVRLAKERKKGDKIVGDSQERAYWRVHRPPPGLFTPLEPCPVPSRDRQGTKPNKKKTVDDVQREVDYLRKSLNRTRMKMSQACESLVSYSETFTEYDFFLQPVLPSNPWVTEDITFWQLNNTFVDIPTEKRVKRWAISIEELVSDPTGLQEFTSFLEKEYSHENIRFWIAVNRLRRSAHSQVARKVNEIYEEFLKPGAPCEINIDGKTMESVLRGLKNPSRFTFDSASEHIYTLLLKKDCYPRFIRSDHYKRLLESGIQPSHKKRFFNFGGVSGAKKKMTAALSSQPNLGETGLTSKNVGGVGAAMMQAPPPGNLARRRGSDRSLTGSAHELAVIGVNKDITSKVPHSHSQSNLSEIPYSSESIYRGDMPQRQLPEVGSYTVHGNRESSLHTHQETSKSKPARLETTVETANSAVCPWDMPDEPPTTQAPAPTATQSQVKLSVCPWEQDSEPSTVSTSNFGASKAGSQRLTSTSSDISDVSDRLQRNLGIRHQNTVDSGEASKRLIPIFTEQRRASVSFTPRRVSDYQYGAQPSASAKTSTTPSPTVGSQSAVDASTFPPQPPPLFTHSIATIAAVTAISSAANANAHSNASGSGIITKDPPSTSDAEVEEELNKLSISELNSESSASDLSALQPPTPTPPPLTKVTPPPPDDCACGVYYQQAELVACESPHSELLAAGSGESGESNTGSVANSETEVEVQIELIENMCIYQEERSVQLTTPTIQVEGEDDELEQQDAAVEVAMTESINNDDDDVPEVSTPYEELDAPLPQTPTPYQVLSTPPSAEQTPERGTSPAGTPERQTSPIIQTYKSAERLSITRSATPPPPPSIGPMEEEQLMLQEQDADDENVVAQEELSPTTDEYQEGIQFGRDAKEDYDYDMAEAKAGYIAPAPTPAPSMAPLAELDLDTVDDEPCDDVRLLSPTLAPAALPAATPAAGTSTSATATCTVPQLPTATTEEVKKRRKKRNSDGKKVASMEDKEKASTSGAGAESGTGAKAASDRNAVCPWEDENVTTSDGTFVKTYATLGYL